MPNAFCILWNSEYEQDLLHRFQREVLDAYAAIRNPAGEHERIATLTQVDGHRLGVFPHAKRERQVDIDQGSPVEPENTSLLPGNCRYMRDQTVLPSLRGFDSVCQKFRTLAQSCVMKLCFALQVLHEEYAFRAVRGLGAGRDGNRDRAVFGDDNFPLRFGDIDLQSFCVAGQTNHELLTLLHQYGVMNETA